MSVFEHNHRARIYNPAQHPYKHTLDDFSYVNDAIPHITNLNDALDYLFAVFYPNTQESVATTGDLPAVGNTIGDYRVVQDDGDGKAASYRWDQREGDVAAKWYKIYDMDWGEESILSSFLLKTQDVYVYRYGYDDTDHTGAALTGDLAGQHLYGGASANTHLTLFANGGDGTGADTGFVQFGDNVRPLTDSSVSLGTTAYRFLKVWADETTVGTLTLAAGSITDSSGAVSFGDENLTTTGEVTATTFIAGTLEISDGAIVDAGGTIDFGATDLLTDGDIDADAAIFGGTLILSTGSIMDTSGVIDFNDENLETTGTLSAGATTVTSLDVGNIDLAGNAITVENVDGDLNISANGAGSVVFGSEIETLDVTSTGTVSVTGQFNADNLRLDGNTLSSTDSNGNINLDPAGTGHVVSFSTVKPDTTSTYDLGATSLVWNNLFLDGAITDGSSSFSVADLFTFADVGTPQNGHSLFWDGAKWVASAPDSEIDHGSIANLGDDDHTQYALLAGRSTGQEFIGGTGSGENLTLDSTVHATKGKILLKSVPAPNTDASYSGSWSGLDLGASANRYRHVYSAGEFFGLRLENRASDDSSSSQRPGRLWWNTSDQKVRLDTGSAIIDVGASKHLSDTSWNGTDLTKDVTISGFDARIAQWTFHDNSSDFEKIYCSVKATSSTNVRITTNVALPAGSYRLIGIA
jgi:hypothetical protein